MRKAFDCVDHEILVDKLRLYNFDRTAVNWFKSYLSDRMQKVMVRNAESEPRTIKCGVLQGSVLGPLLFIILIIDLVLDSELSKNLFADNSTLQLNSGPNFRVWTFPGNALDGARPLSLPYLVFICFDFFTETV